MGKIVTTGAATDAAAGDALLIFHDDSSLAACRRFADVVSPRGWRCAFLLYEDPLAEQPALSARQLRQGLGPHALSHVRRGLSAADPAFLRRFGMIVSAKYPIVFRRLWRWRGWGFGSERPCFVGLFPGLEFKPVTGWRIRRYADVLCCVTRSDVAAYDRFAPPGRPSGQRVLRFHPSLMRATTEAPAPAGPPRRVVFFAQAVSPRTLAGRREVAAVLTATARAHPGVEVVLKLRHRRDENRRHTHRERYDYQSLLQTLAPPSNLVVSDAAMDTALRAADMAITCCSTAGFEALAAGLPTLFLLDYAEAASDPLNAPARRLLAGSGLVAGPEAVMALRPGRADPAWLDDVLSDASDLDAVLAAVGAFDRTGSRVRGGTTRGRVVRAAVALDLALRRRLRTVVRVVRESVRQTSE